ncbi:peptidoglycan-binding domain-containing protein [Vibrio sp. MA40-2]|uniref:peptidoglycan-binding domain-containing protein n=1 Tax=Vibrio sp. MA40-2 TaxID=3391828 RepID=UPI0039A6BB72
MCKKINNNLRFPLLITSILVTVGCTNTTPKENQAPQIDNTDQISATMDMQREKEAQLRQKEIELTRLEEQLTHQSQSEAELKNSNISHLPPNAKAGECYARVWNEPQYKTIEEKVLVREETEKLLTTPAQYTFKPERVLVSEATIMMVPTPAVYTTKQEKILISKADRNWRTELSPTAPLASEEILKRAGANGVDLDSAQPNMCFHEHLLPEKYETVKESVIVGEKSEKLEIVPATYRTVEKKTLIKEASTKLVNVPAVYETITEQIIDKPAHQAWKKGTGAVQKINESTGEIMCLVDIPATYKTVSKRILKTPARTETVDIPAEYKMVSVKEVVTPTKAKRIPVGPKYDYISKKNKVSDIQYVWHETTNQSLTRETRTGHKICLIDTPATYKTINKQVVTQEASVKKTEVPAKYEIINVQKLVSPAKVEQKVTPAEYKMVKRQVLVQDRNMEWRSILCDTNMTTTRISDIQRTLAAKGYNPGKIDGVIGVNTMKAVNAFQRDNNLPIDEYLNISTVEALGVSSH